MCKECGGHSLILWFRGADDKAEKEHLLALAGGDEARVHFFPCDLLGGATMLTAARGCSGIFHLASPCIINRVLNPEKELVVSPMEGTLNMLRTAKDARGVRRVMETTSVSAVVPSPG
ncbi:phenylacetaldehyde reductase-like [Triticum dicoccoides]|uniref:phenylacetaldehyde reductase-like n=1 Tax=Triticum dicoccoides TaxID=85692 RepID=UPI00189184DC|nr:phenylacetaldehyde reductase-like [Triticum dicoccoides]